MNTQDYINELKNQLRKLPDEDREDAISYYFEYLADAGPDGAAEAMKKLGSPAELAAGIRADQAMQDFEESSEQKGGKAVGHGVRAVWLAGLAAVPRTILAIIVTVIIIVVFFAVIIALFAASVLLMGVGTFTAVAAIWAVVLGPASQLFFGGAGLVAAAGGFLLFIFSMWTSKHLLHAIASVFNGIRRKREKKLKRKEAAYANTATGKADYTTSESVDEAAIIDEIVSADVITSAEETADTEGTVVAEETVAAQDTINTEETAVTKETISAEEENAKEIGRTKKAAGRKEKTK